MLTYQREFIEFALAEKALQFGDFTLKSGRKSPYFFNAGAFQSGAALAKLGYFYAHAIQSIELPFDMLFGPAYKGIPLVCATAMALASAFGQDLPYAFNRKEVKDHGEGGQIVGAPLSGNLLLVDDVITAGTAFRESHQLIHPTANIGAMVIALDRQERNEQGIYSLEAIRQEFAVEIVSIVTLQQLIDYLEEDPSDQKATLSHLKRHQAAYGIG